MEVEEDRDTRQLLSTCAIYVDLYYKEIKRWETGTCVVEWSKVGNGGHNVITSQLMGEMMPQHV